MTTMTPASPNAAISGKNKNKDKDLVSFRRALLRWYDHNRRDLPWRETHDPYTVWLSEIMLQQTRVAAVINHYRIFLQRFPDARALAAASEDAVLAAWSGLGYYRRARMLHQCARQIVEQYGGCFPRNSASLLALPGIGRYTAAAIASIAFAEPVAVVDGNVERVLQRLLATDLTTPQLWQRAQAFLSHSRPGDFNQAMMELGATVCVPRQPRCLACPVQKWCATRGDVPAAKTPSRQKKRQIWCVLERRNDNNDGAAEVRLLQRPKTGSLMPGMWELPQSTERPRAVPPDAHWRTFRHSITVTDYTVHVLRSAPPRSIALPGSPRAGRGKWIAIDRIAQLPITGLTRKILRADGII
ncbi:MAG: A/G-specific adenine glycosylase [Terriglobales bacterium]